jgi:hypothetical protein
LYRDRRVPLAGRILRLSVTFRRSLDDIGFVRGTPGYRATFAAIATLSSADVLPGIGDDETLFSPGRAFVRRVSGFNAWILYRFDEENVFVMTVRGEPPVPIDV